MPKTCSICGQPMAEGYCYDGGTKYYCSTECLRHDFSEEEWAGLYEEGGDSYWTTWYDEDDNLVGITQTTVVGTACEADNPHLNSPTTGIWVPVSERLPFEELAAHYAWCGEAEDEFLVMLEGAQIPTALYFNGIEWYHIGHAGRDNYRPTHWMRMPSPPMN